jgi:hypothetical protein
MSTKAEWTEEELLEMLVEARKKKLEKLQKEEAEAKESYRVPPPLSLSSSAPSLARNSLPARTGIKRKREHQPDLPSDYDGDERDTKPAAEAREELGKTTKDESKMASKERSKPTPNTKKQGKNCEKEKFLQGRE